VTVAGLVLAAGAGRRFGGPKAVVELDGERLVDRAVRIVRDGGCEPVVVVTGAAHLEVLDALVVDNPQWTTGMGSSLRSGLAALPEQVTAAVIVLVDTPWLGSEAVRRLVRSHHTGAQLAVATYSGERGHPVLLARPHWVGAGIAATGDTGARGYLASRPDDVVEVDCTGTGDPRDVDDPADLAGTIQRWSRRSRPERWSSSPRTESPP
jgi:CTP:molybdopterin cytidylyltransferase MocA